MRSQRLVGGLSRVRACARIDADQFLPIVRHHEIVFRELETGQGVYAPRHDFADAPWSVLPPRRRAFPGDNILPATILHEALWRRFPRTSPARPRLPSFDQTGGEVRHERYPQSSSRRKPALRLAAWLVPIWRSFL